VLERADQLVDSTAPEGVHPVRPVDRDYGALVLDDMPHVGQLIKPHAGLLLGCGPGAGC
jgi:hypothetical protein